MYWLRGANPVFKWNSGALDVFKEQKMISLEEPFQHLNIVEAGPNISAFDSFSFVLISYDFLSYEVMIF